MFSGFPLDSYVGHSVHSSALPTLNSVQVPRALCKVASLILSNYRDWLAVIIQSTSRVPCSRVLLHLNVGWLLFSLPSPPSVCSANSCSPRSLGKAGPSMTHLPLGGTNKAFLLPVLPGLPLIMVLIMLSGIHLGLLSH